MSVHIRVGGIVVSITASQAVDPGLILLQCIDLLTQISGTGLIVIKDDLNFVHVKLWSFPIPETSVNFCCKLSFI